MLLEHLNEPTWWIGAILVLGFFFAMWRMARKPKRIALNWDYCYDYVSEPLAGANPKLAESFADMLAEIPEGARAELHLIRVAAMNRGALGIQAQDHLRPLTVAFPEGTRLIDAAFVEVFGTDPETPPTLMKYERGIEITPFDLPTNCAMVFQLIVHGGGKPSYIDGGIEGQKAIRKLL
jgi:hypothetical protein